MVVKVRFVLSLISLKLFVEVKEKKLAEVADLFVNEVFVELIRHIRQVYGVEELQDLQIIDQKLEIFFLLGGEIKELPYKRVKQDLIKNLLVLDCVLLLIFIQNC
jgi:hypothetical protein